MLPAHLAENIRKQVLYYLQSTFTFRDAGVERAFELFLNDPENGLFKGPWVQLKLPFRLAAESEVFPLGFDAGFQPFKHQARSWRRLSSEGKKPQHTLVTTGTGSGKTECFLLPILDHCLRAKQQKQKGIKAIILYPMNALASDQERRFAKTIFRNPVLKKAGIRVGNYTGRYDPASEGGGADSGTLKMGEDHGISNHNMQQDNPPDILLTNYKMLDYLLMRPQDQRLWRFNDVAGKPDGDASSQPLQYLVLDELHTYDGAQGADVGCLIRRLKERLAIAKGDLCVVGTSATLDDRDSLRDSVSNASGSAEGTGATTDVRQTGSERLAKFASTLFEEEIDEESVIGEMRMTVEEIVSFNVEETVAPKPADCLPGETEDAVLYAIRQCQLWDGPAYSGPELTSQLLAKQEHELSEADKAALSAVEQWSVELGEWLKRQRLFKYLLEIFEAADRNAESLTWVGLVNELSRKESAEFTSHPAFQDRSDLCASFFALVAQAKEIRSNYPFPLVPTQVQLWIRELRRLGRIVDEKPQFSWLDEPTQGLKSLPTFHCSECGESGWIGLHNPENDNLIGSKGVAGFQLHDDASQIYRSWFGYKDIRSPNIVVISPQKAPPVAADPETIQWDEQQTFDFSGEPTLQPQAVDTGETNPQQMEFGFKQWYMCPSSLVVRMEDGPCPLTHDPRRFRVKINRSTLSHDKKGLIGTQGCPNCGSSDGILFIGSQSATLSSVAIDELFGSVLNSDPKLLAFTDSVQDASHRAGFFSARTYNFTFRTALRQVVEEAGPNGISLEEAGTALLDGWSQPRPGWPGHVREAMASLMPPDLHDYADFLKYRNRNTSDPPSERLLSDVTRRLTWQATSEFGVRLLRGRTLEMNGSVCLEWDKDRVERTVTRLREQLESIDPLLCDLEDDTIRIWVYGFLHRARNVGALDHPYMDTLAERQWWGKYPFGNAIAGRETYPPGHPAYEPRLIVTKNYRRHEHVLAPSRGAQVPWHLMWSRRALNKKNVDETTLLDLIKTFLRVGKDSGLLTSLHQGTEREYIAISAKAARLVPGGVHFVCSDSGRSLIRPAAEAIYWDCAPSLEYYSKDGKYERRDFTPRQCYYQDRYRKGALRRVVANEHTGLLATEEREQLEREFSASEHTDDPNVLTCTSTLEMGIDIGDLSSTMLCSIPPSTANYLQRIGRAGRSTGTALIVSVVNQRPHDLFFYGRPSEMLRGKVDPPGCWLDASAVLVRQYYAFCLDSATKTKNLKSLPRTGKDLVDDLAKTEGSFRTAFTWIGLNEIQLRNDFLNRYAADRVQDDTRKRFLEESQAEILLTRTEQATAEFNRSMRDLRNAMNRLDSQLKALDEDAKDIRREIEQEKRILSGRNQSLRRTTALEILTDNGLLPNYAFPERGVRFYGAIYNKHRRDEDNQSSIEVTRPAGVALKELAPSNHFYTHSRRFEVQQIAVGSQNEPLIQRWGICGNCGHMRPAEDFTKPNAQTACPQCGHDGDSSSAADQGQQRMFIEYSRSQALSYMEHYESLSGDLRDERERTHYQTIRSFDLTGEKPSAAVGDAELPFGMEYRSSVLMREVNVGYSGAQPIVPFGVDQAAPEEGFQVCMDCGVVVPASGNHQDAKHRRSCSRRRANDKRKQENKDLLPYKWEHVYLHRDLRSEAIRLLLPIASAEEIDTLRACIQLGLRLRFEGNPAHLIVSPQVMPDSYSSMSRYYVILLDAVPGGTGYLKTLYQEADVHGREGEGIMQVLRLAKNALETCTCRRIAHSPTQPDTDGCYRCVRTYHMQYSADSISRERGIELLDRLIKAGEQRLPQKELTKIRVDSLFESMLEKKFVDQLQKFVDSRGGQWEQTIIRGRSGFRFSVPGADHFWELELQPLLGSAQGVDIASNPDFLLRCDSGLVKPIAIFTDGFEFHCHPVNRIADDLQKRRSILESERFHVWSITWKDLVEDHADQNMVCHQPIADRFKQFASAARGQGKQVPDPLKILKGGFEQLKAFIETPHAAGWTQLATSATAYYLHRLTDRRTIKSETLKSALESWQCSGSIDALQHDSAGTWVHNEKTSLTDDLISYAKVDDVLTNRLHKLILIARLSDSDEQVQDPAFELRWRQFLACLNLYQFLGNHYFWAESEIAAGECSIPIDAKTVIPEAWQDICSEVASSVQSYAEELAAAGLTEEAIPEVEYYCEAINDDAFAEMAWPNTEPPVAVLAGDQSSLAAKWQQVGWKIYTPDSLQATGVAELIERIT